MPNKAKGKSSKEYYERNPNSKRKKKSYDKKYGASSEQKKRRALRNKSRRAAVAAGRAKKGDGKDVHHVGGNLRGKTKVEAAAKNRGRREKSRRKKS